MICSEPEGSHPSTIHISSNLVVSVNTDILESSESRYWVYFFQSGVLGILSFIFELE